MRSSSGAFSISANAQKVDVDNRIALRYYYRIADNLLRQADIYREEKNIIDLYIMLMRFSSLISETIPCHRDFQVSLKRERLSFKKKLLNALTELETLKPTVQSLIEELNRKRMKKVAKSDQVHQIFSNGSSLEWPAVKKQIQTNYEIRQVQRPVGRDVISQGSWGQVDKFSHSPSMEGQIRVLSLSVPRPKEETLSRHSILGPNGLRGQWQPPSTNRGVQYPSNLALTPVEIPSSLSVPRPKEETLSRHSILGPNGLRGQWQPPSTDTGVQYPSNLDLTPVEMPSLIQPAEDGVVAVKDSGDSESERSTLESVLSLNDGRWSLPAEEPCTTTTSDTIEAPIQIDIIRQPSPPPVLADVQDLIPIDSSQVTDSRSGPAKCLQDELAHSESPLQVHISTKMMDSFMRMAKSNTDRNLETCGVLAGSLKNRKFFVTALIIPKQESTSDSCQTTNEEEIFEVQDKQSLFPLGWIHIMLPEAIAIVMAPTDSSRKHGIFRLTTPGGMSVIRQCPQRGFHHHDEPAGGGPIYDSCSDVYMNPSLKFDVMDLR
ncbi:AMSH-like ubiquitin thioesterase 1 isoform X2 [Magnolia sinica]|uniref:AMSH-like ubiquitin thioesterase 1 isoform X2 n=1 Tax=Magnolia sinica TaxID=86752 RepID=UPI00265AE612|nr:AMSH-like ubiquitin thioesterase 1 isoform X2 [Magnolia sinica]